MVQPKVDGWRAQVVVTDVVTVRSRNGKALKVPELDELLELAAGRRMRLDGELVVMAGAVADWHALSDQMRRGAGRSPHSAGFLAFDLLELDGVDLTSRPWIARQEALSGLELRSAHVGAMPTLTDACEAWSRAQTNGWEGIVYKRTASPWRAGERSPDWRKRKVSTRGELVVTGYRATAGVVDMVVVSQRQPDSSLVRRGVLDYPSQQLSQRVLHLPVLAGPDREGWSSVEPTTAVTVQYRLSPSGGIREPRLIGSVAGETGLR